MTHNHTKTNLKARDGAHNRKQPHKRGLLLSFIIFMVWVAGIGLLISLFACQPVNAKQIATDDSRGYYKDLSKISSDMPSRTPLAFFVPDSSAASQAVTMTSSTAPNAQLSASREHSLISIASHLLTDYDGLTLQNRTAERRICRAVATNTESKTRHPILLPYSVAFTQKLVGGYHA
ncbi:hypothetical protein AADH33_13155 [Psychrobacter sp. KFRI-CH2-11]|uniref:hypothetical protein n=1 Tax=Psychrobacter sp. KFRI-CH2-11 TaxID=3156079 RepID=UPI00324E2551